MISNSLQIGLIGVVAIIGGTYVLVRRKSLAKANARNMTGQSWWETRFDYSEDYFRLLGTTAGIFFILVGIISLVVVLFRNSENQLPAPLKNLMMTLVGIIFTGGLIMIVYLNYRFRKTK